MRAREVAACRGPTGPPRASALDRARRRSEVPARRMPPQVLRRLKVSGRLGACDARPVAVGRDPFGTSGPFQRSVDQLRELPAYVRQPRVALQPATFRGTSGGRPPLVRAPEPERRIAREAVVDALEKE